MKFQVLPLIAAFTLSNAVNAKNIELECLSQFTFMNGRAIDYKFLPEKYYLSVDLETGESFFERDGEIYKVKTYIDNTSFSFKVSDQSGMIHWQDSYSISRVDGSYINRYRALASDPTSSFYSKKIFNNAMKIIREGKDSEEKKRADVMIYGYSKHGYCRKAKKIINIMI